MMKYRLKYPFSEKSCLPCAIKGIGVVDLSGNGYEKVVPASIHGPERRIKIRGATQKDLKRLYELGGTNLVEKVVPQKEEVSDVGTD